MSLYRAYSGIKEKIQQWETKKRNEDYRKKILAKGGHIGKGTDFGDGITITGLNNIHLGNNVWIGERGWIRAEGGLTIEDNTIISRNLVLYTINHNYKNDLIPFNAEMLERPVHIEENVWIGMNVTIAPGTHIGEGSIIGLGARVFGTIPPLSIIGSNGQKISERDPEHYYKLKEQKAFGDFLGNPFKIN